MGSFDIEGRPMLPSIKCKIRVVGTGTGVGQRGKWAIPLPPSRFWQDFLLQKTFDYYFPFQIFSPSAVTSDCKIGFCRLRTSDLFIRPTFYMVPNFLANIRTQISYATYSFHSSQIAKKLKYINTTSDIQNTNVRHSNFSHFLNI